MALPKRRISRARAGYRSIREKLEKTELVACKNCGSKIRPHHVCPGCGQYRGKQILPGNAPAT
ncbi:MAG: 50S ribosomal protein L32 [Planctomycetes bacterium]|nr:50S ribosomal protein L32 [Planctomycetota bacterium]